jgi:hypothetical protein
MPAERRSVPAPLSPPRRVDRGHHRLDVQRQDRGAHPPRSSAPPSRGSASRPSSPASTIATTRRASSATRLCRAWTPSPSRPARASSSACTKRHAGRRHRRGAVLRSRASSRCATAPRQPRRARHRAGLDQDYLGRPFHPCPSSWPSPRTSPRSTRSARCAEGPACRSQRSSPSRRRPCSSGGSRAYEARCRDVFRPARRRSCSLDPSRLP